MRTALRKTTQNLLGSNAQKWTVIAIAVTAAIQSIVPQNFTPHRCHSWRDHPPQRPIR
ncbi:hypothetical protein ETAA8_67530 [Anatilimnocola aggregata]|uniref:Uncharacterized protein n=1 Tax=Anatilimnocola aggregata TaxID=2528021 RepID=A0A517YMZ9_9BACT|nr:hypothetical protein ETAA8_67530 [Anatilimnocola aggregata]